MHRNLSTVTLTTNSTGQIMSPVPLPLKVGVTSPSSYGIAAHGSDIESTRGKVDRTRV